MNGPAAVKAIQANVIATMHPARSRWLPTADTQDVNRSDRGAHDERSPIQDTEALPTVDSFHPSLPSCFPAILDTSIVTGAIKSSSVLAAYVDLPWATVRTYNMGVSNGIRDFWHRRHGKCEVIARNGCALRLPAYLTMPAPPAQLRLHFQQWVIEMPLSKVVIVGRPNVGKSSLFNWLAGRKISIIDPMAGVTRDRVGSLVQLGDDDDPRFIELFDTGGVGMVDRDDLSDHVERQIETAMNEADLILFVVDIRNEMMPLDVEVAARLRYLKTPVILVMNKADVPEFDHRGAEFYKLGRGKPLAVSVHQNRNKKQLLKMIDEMLPASDAAKPSDAAMKIAVVGRPNTGKSTFINTLARAERMIVSERPGTTRDSVDVHFELDGMPFLAIDTAGIKRHSKIRDNLDFYSVHRAQRSIRRADVVLLFLDASQGITRLDKQLADYIAQEHRPCIFTINKWDLMSSDPADPSQGNMGRFATGVQYAFRSMSYMPMAFITAQTGKNVKALDQSFAITLQTVAKASEHGHAQPDRPRGRRRTCTQLTRKPHAADLLRHPGRRRSTDDRPVREYHQAIRLDVSALSAQYVSRKTAVP